jgi:uncharacterized membrane protein
MKTTARPTKNKHIMKTNNSIIEHSLSCGFLTALLCTTMAFTPFAAEARDGGEHGGGFSRRDGSFGRHEGGFGRREGGFIWSDPGFGWGDPGFGWGGPSYDWVEGGFRLGHEHHHHRR